VNIAIGYGFNPSEAKFNANLASEKFDVDSKNLTYIVPRQNSAIGPLNFLVGDDLEVDRIEEDYISALSKEIGISQTMLYKLYSMIERQKRNSCTSQDLADKLAVSQRNANRLLRKLEDYGYAKVVGKRLTGQSGRPSDIYDISLSKGK
jgi:CRP-like cAMP-binding protein